MSECVAHVRFGLNNLIPIGGQGEPPNLMFVAVDRDSCVGRLVRVDPDRDNQRTVRHSIRRIGSSRTIGTATRLPAKAFGPIARYRSLSLGVCRGSAVGGRGKSIQLENESQRFIERCEFVVGQPSHELSKSLRCNG